MANTTVSSNKWQEILRARAEGLFKTPYMTPGELSDITGIKPDRFHQAAYTGAIKKVSVGRYALDGDLLAFITRRSSQTGFRLASTKSWLEAARKMVPESNGEAGEREPVRNTPDPVAETLHAMHQTLVHMKDLGEKHSEWLADLSDRVEKLEGAAHDHTAYRAGILLERLVRKGAPEDVILEVCYSLFDGTV